MTGTLFLQFYSNIFFFLFLKTWNASRICVSSLHRGHANLLYIVPILVCVLPNCAQCSNIFFLNGFSFFFLIFFFFLLFRATPAAYGGSQARGLIGAVAARATATPDPRLVCDLYHQSRQCQILNPLRKARDRTHSLMHGS